MLGGIGFTWEHDAHLYLRRAIALRQLLGGGRPVRGPRWPSAALAGHASPPHPRPAARGRGGPGRGRAPLADEIAAAPEGRAARAARRRRAASCPHWPPPWGRDATAVEQLVIDQELRRVRVRVPHLQVGGWAAPTIAAHGTTEQQERWVRPTLLGDDRVVPAVQRARGRLRPGRAHHHRHPHRRRLAAQRPEGVDDAWPSEADWGICLVRTNPDRAEAPRHHLRHRRHDGAGHRHPAAARDDRPGDVQRGVPRRRVRARRLRDRRGRRRLAAGPHDAGQRAGVDGQRRRRSAAASSRCSAWSASASTAASSTPTRCCSTSSAPWSPRRTRSRCSACAPRCARSPAPSPGPEASVRKLLGVEHDQRTQELGLTLLGPEGATTDRRRRPVDLRLPRQPLPHHRRRHQRDPAQRHRRAPPRPPERPVNCPRSVALSAHHLRKRRHRTGGRR